METFVYLFRIFGEAVLGIFLTLGLVGLVWGKTNWSAGKKKWATVGIAVVFLCAIFVFGQKLHKQERNIFSTALQIMNRAEEKITPKEPFQEELAKVARVVDGDTIKLEDGRTVRYIGIDAPETVDPRRPVECFGKEASAKNKELVEGKEARLVKDASETDKYGRLLRYVFVGDTFVNEFLVRDGYAHASSYPPDVHFQQRLGEAQQEAKKNKRGLWGERNCSRL